LINFTLAENIFVSEVQMHKIHNPKHGKNAQQRKCI